MLKLVVLFSVVALAMAKPGYVAPLAYSSVVPAVSSVSQYSSSVAHGAPLVAPHLYGAGVYGAGVPAIYGGGVPAVYGAGLYSQAPHSPAVVLDPIHGVPLDTPEVVAARAAHYQAKALSGHHLGKRSLAYSSAVVAPVAYSSPLAYSAPVVSAYGYGAPVVSAYSSPLVSAYSSPLYAASVLPKAYSVHPY